MSEHNYSIPQPMPNSKNFHNLTGRKFGMWTVKHYAGKRNGISMWFCQCDCGGESVVEVSNLNSGNSTNCGCVRKKTLSAIRKTHGFRANGVKHELYAMYANMKTRCNNPNYKQFSDYGGRGVFICERWKNGDGLKTGFECFLEDMGPRPTKNHTIERRDNDGPYSPENCIWATRKQQMRNMRRTHMVEYNGRMMVLQDAVNESGMHQATVNSRLSRGMTPQEALTTPPKKERSVIYAGKEMPLSEALAASGITRSVFQRRHDLGWTDEKALTTPIKRR